MCYNSKNNLNCRVNWQNIQLIVDAGANVTVLSCNFINRLRKLIVPSKELEWELLSTMGYAIQIYGISYFSFQTHPLKFKRPCYVVDPRITAPTDSILSCNIIIQHHLMILLHNSRIILDNSTQVNFKDEICNQAVVKSSLQPNTIASTRNKSGRKQHVTPTNLQMSNCHDGVKAVHLLQDRLKLPTKEVHNNAHKLQLIKYITVIK